MSSAYLRTEGIAMPRMIGSGLSRRERQILDILHRKGRASAADVLAEMPDPPTYSAVRSLLRIMEEKGYVRHEGEGKKYLYSAAEPRQSAAQSALKQVVRTFFGGSLEHAVKTFLSDEESDLSDEELERLSKLIEQARAAQPAEEGDV
jgi:predicted transcriptional regulator